MRPRWVTSASAEMAGLQHTVRRQWARASLLQRALLVSLALHVFVIALRFSNPKEFDRMFTDATLDVVLVNARSELPPENAQALAQTSLAGGGEAAQGIATSMLAPAPESLDGDAIQAATAQERQSLQQQQNLLLSRVKEQLTALSEAQNKSASSPQEREALEKKRREMVRLLAKIENRIDAENARPRKRYVSPAVREVSYAVYYDGMRQTIEARGTTYFPQKGGEKLYGSLTMVLTVDDKGVVLEAEVAKSSGNRDLDRRAQEIARKAGPFGAFTPEMRKTVDQLVVVSRFTFTKDATLQTKAMVPQ